MTQEELLQEALETISAFHAVIVTGDVDEWSWHLARYEALCGRLRLQAAAGWSRRDAVLQLGTAVAESDARLRRALSEQRQRLRAVLDAPEPLSPAAEREDLP